MISFSTFLEKRALNMFRRGLLVLDPLQVQHFDFSLNLTRQLSGSGISSNLCFSPASVTLALAMCYFGASGPTKLEMARKIFGGSGNDTDDGNIKQWSENLIKQASAIDDESFRLKFANRIYLNENFELKEKYVKFLQSAFQADAVLRANFGADGPRVAERINSWVENVTNHLIKGLVSADSINAQTVMLLINALYFKGVWEKEFYAQATKSEDFHSTTNKVVKIDMMHKTDRQSYYEDGEIQALSLSYYRSSVKAVFVLPKKKNDLKNVVDGLDGRKLLNWLKSMEPNTKVEMAIPKFRIEQSFVLNRALKSIGLSSPFKNGADFSAMTNGNVKISDVIHKTFINLDEKGTEAAAATVIRFASLSLLTEKIPIEPKKFIADHPFLFLIMNKDEHILFIGQFFGNDAAN
uniref:Serpin domain-containing protein n=1 Tax=Romanomermis culicivorax TaxID=13658 RepID=A0A915KX42_ROMCU